MSFPRLAPLPLALALLAAPAAAQGAAPLAMASLLLGDDNPGFSVAHAATAMGIPLVETRDVSVATRQPMLVLAGQISGPELPAGTADQLETYVQQGGILVLDDTEATTARRLAGVVAAAPLRSRFTMRFDETGNPGFVTLTAPESRTISLGSRTAGQAIWTQGLTPAAGVKVLARFDDGQPALVRRDAGRGHVYTLGARLDDLVLRPQDNRDPESQRWYDNHFEPSADVPQELLRGWYLGEVPGAVAKDPAPDGREGSFLMTHDIDFQRSVLNMPAYANAEKARGVRSTFFTQTKIVKDYQDIAFFNDQARQILRQVAATGADIESHTVSHAYDWRSFPRGTGKESAATYRPRITGRGATDHSGSSVGTSMIGEMRVSKQLLEGALPGRRVQAFRTGYLAINVGQWDLLQAEGYRYDSSYSADDVMTCFPYRAMSSAGFERETGILEMPVLLADSVKPMLPHVPAFCDVLDREAAFHGCCVVLIHPDVIADKLPTEMALLDHVKGRFWVGTLLDFARFWNARAEARVEAVPGATGETVTVTASAEADGLTLDLPPGMRVVNSGGATATPAQNGRAVVLKGLNGEPVTLTLAR